MLIRNTIYLILWASSWNIREPKQWRDNLGRKPPWFGMVWDDTVKNWLFIYVWVYQQILDSITMNPKFFVMLYHHNCWPPNFSDHVLPHFFIQRVLKGTPGDTDAPSNLRTTWTWGGSSTSNGPLSRERRRGFPVSARGKSGIDGDSPCRVDLKNSVHFDIVFQNLWYYCRQLMSIWCSILFAPKRK